MELRHCSYILFLHISGLLRGWEGNPTSVGGRSVDVRVECRRWVNSSVIAGSNDFDDFHFTFVSIFFHFLASFQKGLDHFLKNLVLSYTLASSWGPSLAPWSSVWVSASRSKVLHLLSRDQGRGPSHTEIGTALEGILLKGNFCSKGYRIIFCFTWIG